MAKITYDENSDDYCDIVCQIAAQNTPEYNTLKLCEELAELQEKLLKSHLKVPEYKPSTEEIVEEIGDVMIRLMAYVGENEPMQELIETRIDYKIKKMVNSFNTGKYKGGV